MTKFNPTVTITELEEAAEKVSMSVKSTIQAKTRMEDNPYTGKYAPLFAKLYKDIYAAVFAIRREFADGFQVSDLDDVLIVAAPALMKVYRAVDAEGIKDSELDAFMTDLVMFMYYELDDLIKWGWLKWILKLVFKWFAAKKLGKLLSQVVRYIDGKLDATEVDERVLTILQGVRNWLNGVAI